MGRFSVWLEQQEEADPRLLDEYDYSLFDDALNQRKPPKNLEAIKKRIRQKNWVRWHRIHSDFRWLQREMKKQGLNPEDARWIL